MKNMTTKLAGIAVLGVFALFLSNVVKNTPTNPSLDTQANAVESEPNAAEALVKEFSKPLTNLVVPAYLDKNTLDSCLANKEIADSITKTSDFSAEKGTPLLYIGNEKRMYEVQGALPYEWFGKIITALASNKDFEIPKEASENIAKVTDSNVLKELSISGNEAIRGNVNGPISIIEYSDISCPFCQRAHATLIKIVSDFPQTKWVYRHHPLVSIHPHALEESIAAECIRLKKDSDSFWKFMDSIMATPLSY